MSQSQKLKVKCIHEGVYNNARISKGEVFYIRSEQEYSYLWMKAIGWTPGAPPPAIAEIMDSPEHKAKAMEFKPHDSRTHGKKNAAPDEDEVEEFDHKAPPVGEVGDEDELAPPKKNGPRAKAKDVI